METGRRVRKAGVEEMQVKMDSFGCLNREMESHPQTATYREGHGTPRVKGVPAVVPSNQKGGLAKIQTAKKSAAR